MHNLMNSGLVVDISKEKYFPVQSRIDAKFDQSALNEIGQLIPSIIFVNHLYLKTNGQQNIRLPMLLKNNVLFNIDQYIPESSYNPSKISRLDTLIPTYKLNLDILLNL